MRTAGTLVRLALISCGSAAAAALVSVPFLTPAVAMAPLSETASPSPGVPAVTAVGAVPAVGAGAVPPLAPGHGPGIIRRIDNPDRQVAFTFDACATNTQANGFDRDVLHVLQREHVPATIFTSGRWVEFHPEAMRELVAEPLIEFANHSYDHPHMGRLNTQAIADELDRTEAALGRYGRQSVAFRPPFGDFNQRVLDVAREKRLPPVLWDVVSGDPSARATAEAMIRSVVRQTRPGSIIIFHINARETKTADALPAIFHQLRDRGFQFVHLSALLGRRQQLATPAAVAPVAAPAPPPVAAPPAPVPVDGDDVMPPSAGDGVSDVNAPEGTSSEASGRQPPLSGSRLRRPRSPVSLTRAAVSTRVSVTPPPFAPAGAQLSAAVSR